MPYIGRTLGQGTRSRFLYTATAGQTTFSGSDSQSNTLAYADNNGLDCFQNGVLLKRGGADYTATTGTSVVLTTGASVSDVIEILVYDVFAIADHVKKSGDTMTGALTVNSSTANAPQLIVGGTTGGGNRGIALVDDNAVKYNFFIGAQNNVNNAFEITPSTAAGGTTYSNPALVIDSSGNLLVGQTSANSNATGIGALPYGSLFSCRDGGAPFTANRKTSHGDILVIQKDGSTVGSIGSATEAAGAGIYVGKGDTCLAFQTRSDNSISPFDADTGASRDNAIDLGNGAARFDDIFATNTSITTSDQNEKQDIASATAKELNVAKKLSALFKTFRWKDKVTEKGDKARTHTGIVAQEVQSAFKAEGLDASNYGLFTSDTWWEKEIKVDAVKADEEKGIEAKDAYTYMDTKDEKTDGYTERTRLGVRYPELFSFIFSSIEARLTALESK